MNINDEFPSKFLKAADIKTDQQVTMKSVSRDEVGQGDTKPILFFNEFEKGLVLNKTNANNVASLYGPETDAWIGKSMTIATAWVDFQGQSTQAIRLYPPQQQNQYANQSAGAQYDERNPPPHSGN